MPKLGKWHDMRKTMPLLERTCLIDLGDYLYRVVTLEMEEEEKTGRAIAFFRDWEDNGGRSHELTEVKRWAYIELDEVEE